MTYVDENLDELLIFFNTISDICIFIK